MVEQYSRTRIDVYKPGRKRFFIFGQDNSSVVPDESQVFNLGEVVSHGQFQT